MLKFEFRRQAFPLVISVIAVTLLISMVIVAPSSGQNLDTPTPTPTKSLVSQVGFSDSTLDGLQAKNIDTLGEDLEFTGYGHAYRLFSVVKKYSDNAPLVADAVVLLYQIDTTRPKLIWMQPTNGRTPLLADTRANGNTWPAPSDWTGNGEILFGVFGLLDSTSWASSILYVYELQPNGTVTSLLKGTIPPGYIVKSVEQQENGSLLMIVDDIRGQGTMGISGCCGLRITHYFGWRDGKLADISSKYPEKYYGEIGRAIYAITTWKMMERTGEQPALYAQTLLEILMVYDTLGQHEIGWMLVMNLVSQAKQSNSLVEGSYVDQLFFPTMAQLFKDGKPFVQPDYVGTKARPLQDFYAEESLPNSQRTKSQFLPLTI